MADPLVSIVIPTYNRALLGPDSVRSALSQSYPRCEVIVADDGSTDDTVARLEREFGAAIRIVRQQHAGPAVARNAGIHASTGELVAFLDSDDIWMPEKLERCVPALLARPEIGVAYTALRIRELDSGRAYLQPQYTLSGPIARELFLECKGVNTSTLLARRSCLEKVGGFDEEFFRVQDWDLMLRLAEVTEYVHVPEVLTERRLHAQGLSVTHQELYARFNLLVLQKALARRPDLYRPLAAEALSRAHYRFGMLHYGDYRMAEARAEFRRSLSHRWNRLAADYLLRACLPVGWVRRLRARRLAAQEKRNG